MNLVNMPDMFVYRKLPCLATITSKLPYDSQKQFLPKDWSIEVNLSRNVP